MEMFVGANCMQFHNVQGEFTLAHHDLWKVYIVVFVRVTVCLLWMF